MLIVTVFSLFYKNDDNSDFENSKINLF